MIARNSPFFTEKERLSTAFVRLFPLPKVLVTFSTERILFVLAIYLLTNKLNVTYFILA